MLNAPREYKTRGLLTILDIPAEGNHVYYKGAMVTIGSSGYAVLPSDAADHVPLGVFTGRQAQKLTVAEGDHPILEIETGLIWIAHASATQASVGKLFYLADDGSLTETAGNRTWGLLCKGQRPGNLLMDFRAPIKTA